MGEEQKETENKEQQEKKEEATEEKKEEEKKEEEPSEIVLKVDMHCEGCARKVEKCLRKFEGVEDVKADSKSKIVVIKGKTVDPVKICERVQKKTGKKVELISPLPKPPEEEKKEENKEAEEEKKEEPKAITVILKVRMHCEACAQVLQKRIRKMEGVESVVTDLSNDQVIVKGIIDPGVLVENVYRRTRKQASIVQDEEKKEEEKKPEEEEKKEENKEEKEEEKKEGEEGNEAKKYEYWPYRDHVEYAYTPQVFSDENPNACSVM
ncbi:heavy metal-associated isoprenylated plant protein 7-like [Ananas comosus]|uniref:Heavy metal-associated isoprenylated plant protein 26 n=1 Tax=Ananas comosus TaxID=4615 RepID=A0A199V6Y9_ANACO|nr:heavy metal-associated isoprenylated plant protein 7-like [Ananas comosus]OAY72839.1 Heavy metal-associated isoprenylated plant protein 26 [Ananas comosus]